MSGEHGTDDGGHAGHNHGAGAWTCNGLVPVA